LTDDADTGSEDQGRDLYEYDTEDHELADLSVGAAPADSDGAQVLGLVGINDDGSAVYFVATGNLAAGAVSGQPNLYLARGGQLELVATLEFADSSLWTGSTSSGTPPSRFVAPEGGEIAFPSTARLSGFANGGHTEIYLFDPGTKQLHCVSCAPDGTAPTGDAGFGRRGENFSTQATGRAISGDGSRVFFQTPDPLLTRDGNNLTDVYVYENGAVDLISTGQSEYPSEFFGASESGDDVFFTTREQLANDTDQNVDLYDARVDGGFAGQVEGVQAPCVAEACRGSLTPPAATLTPASAALTGPQNPKHKQPKKKHHKKKPKKHRHKKKKPHQGHGGGHHSPTKSKSAKHTSRKHG
jgi:hypothetical protein